MITGKKIILTAIGIFLAAAVGLYAVFYAPLVNKLRKTAAQCAVLEKDAALVRDAADMLKRPDDGGPPVRKLLGEDEISGVIEDLTRVGKLRKVRFISLTPGEAPAEAGSGFRALPLELEAESGYREMGIFMSELDSLPKGLFIVKGFDIAPDSRNPAFFRSKLSLNLYLAPPLAEPEGPPATGESLLAPQRAAKRSAHDSWTRNPFEIQRNAAVSNSAGLILNGIAYDKVNPAAILNGKIVKVGDFVGDYKVIAIYPDKVLVSGDAETVDIELNPETAGEI